MKSIVLGAYRVDYNDAEGWDVDLILPLPDTWRAPHYLCGLIPLIGKERMGTPPTQPLYNPDTTSIYISYIATTNEQFPILVVGKLSSPETKVIAEIYFPGLPIGDYKLDTPYFTGNVFPICGVSYITFNPEPALWTFIILRVRNNETYPYIGILFMIPLNAPQQNSYITFSPPNDALQFDYPVAPTKKGIIFRYVSLYSRSEPPPQGSGPEKWLHAFLSVSDGSYNLLATAHRLPQEAASLAITPQERILGFDTGERITVLSPYEELRWEWNEDTNGFLMVETGGTRTPLLSGLPLESAYKVGSFIFGLQSERVSYVGEGSIKRASLKALSRLSSTPSPYKEVIINPNAKNISPPVQAYPQVAFPLHVEGDSHHVAIFSSQNNILISDLLRGKISEAISISRLTTDMREYLLPTSSGIATITAIGELDQLLWNIARAGFVYCLPTTPVYVPVWMPYGGAQDRAHGHFALFKWNRYAIAPITQVTVTTSENSVILTFPVPVTKEDFVSFAVENPPEGYLPYSFLGSTYIIADSVKDSFGWEIRVGENEWRPFRGIIRRETPTSPPYEIRVRVVPVYSPYLRVLMRKV